MLRGIVSGAMSAVKAKATGVQPAAVSNPNGDFRTGGNPTVPGLGLTHGVSSHLDGMISGELERLGHVPMAPSGFKVDIAELAKGTYDIARRQFPSKQELGDYRALVAKIENDTATKFNQKIEGRPERIADVLNAFSQLEKYAAQDPTSGLQQILAMTKRGELPLWLVSCFVSLNPFEQAKLARLLSKVPNMVSFLREMHQHLATQAVEDVSEWQMLTRIHLATVLPQAQPALAEFGQQYFAMVDRALV